MIETTRSRLAAARSAATNIASWEEISLHDGCRIGAEIENEGLAAGWQRVGWKLGFGATPVGVGHRWTNRLHETLLSSVEITFT